jgi:lysozyme
MKDLVISAHGLAMIEAFEGFFPKPYRCPAGVLTQGYGHTAMAGGEPIGGTWSRAKARQVLRDDLARRYEPGVRRLLKRTPTQGQYDALVSFAFNCGEAALARSSILKFFNRGEDAQAAAAFALWVKAAGKTMPGLVRRRGSEALAYQGIMDTDWDGRRDKDEPVYGRMPQLVDKAREKIAASGTVKGAGTAALGGVAVIGDTLSKAQEQIEAAEPHLSAGTYVGLALGAIIIAGAGFAIWRRWDDAGRPLPAFLRRRAA